MDSSTCLYSTSKHSYSINLDALATRLLKLGLPTQGQVELKLCVRTENLAKTTLLHENDLKDSLFRQHYKNNQLVTRIQYSNEPFLGEEYKMAFRAIEGNLIFFPPPGETDNQKGVTLTLDSKLTQ